MKKNAFTLLIALVSLVTFGQDIPGLNHLFQECETGLPTEYATIE